MSLKRALYPLLLALASVGCEGTAISVSGSKEGGQAVISGDGGPPVVAIADEAGVHGPPTPTPGQPTPIYPVATPAPTKTPRPA